MDKFLQNLERDLKETSNYNLMITVKREDLKRLIDNYKQLLEKKI